MEQSYWFFYKDWIVIRCSYIRLGCWWIYSLPSHIFSWSGRMVNHIGIEIRPNFLLSSSSGESWTLCESMIQQYHVKDEDLSIVNFCSFIWIMISKWKAPTNFVPAVAVKRGEQVLLGIIGRKGCVGCIYLHVFKDNGFSLL